MADQKGAASEKELAELHKLLTKAYDKSLQRMIEDGEVNASLLTSVANFLRANGIEATTDNEDMNELKGRAGQVLDFPFDPDKQAEG